jgi:protein-disulfide isomerase
VRLVTSRLAWLSVVLVFLAAIGCKAQEPKESSIKDPFLARQIEILVRSKYNVPPEYNVILGARTASPFTGYDKLNVLLAKDGRTTPVDFLISTDDKTLARLETFDLLHIPAENIPVKDRPIRGNPNAKVTVINFDDLQCPYCARMHQELFPTTLERYKDKVRFVYKDDPLTDLHPWALHAAVDANCIADQNASAYWGYVDYLHAHGQQISGVDRDPQKSFQALDSVAREQGKIFSLDPAKLDACLQKQDETSVRASMKEAESLGIEGTPALYIEGEHIDGALPTEQVWAVIDRALRAAGVDPPPPPAAQPVPAPTLGH